MAFERMAPAYDAGRTPTAVTLERWRAILATYLGSRGRTPVLDLGAGTGQWAEALSRWFELDVIAIEPSEGMRGEGVARRRAVARWIAGSGDRLPLRDDACGAAWLSSVIHHIPDLDAAARGLRRVVRAEGPVLIRNGFPGELRDRDPLYRFFPTARRFADAFPAVERVVEAFAAAGFSLREHRVVDEVVAFGLRDYYARVRARADSTLTRLPDEEFRRGLAALERAAKEDDGTAPVVDGWEFLAFS